MRRIAAILIASICAIAVSGCIVVPPRHGGYYHDRGGYGYDHGYHGR